MKKIQTLAMVMGLMVAAANVAPAQGIGISTGGDEAGISMDAGDKKKKKKRAARRRLLPAR